MSDEEILKQSYKSPSMFGELFDKHSKRFLNIAMQSIGKGTVSKDRAEDIVQEVFVRIYKYGQKFLEKSADPKFLPWSNMILRNCIIDHYKKESGLSPLTEEMESTLEAPDEWQEFESENFFNSLLNKVDSVSAEVLRLRFSLGKSYKEIGKLLGVSAVAARVKIYRAKKEIIKFIN